MLLMVSPIAYIKVVRLRKLDEYQVEGPVADIYIYILIMTFIMECLALCAFPLGTHTTQHIPEWKSQV